MIDTMNTTTFSNAMIGAAAATKRNVDVPVFEDIS